MFRRIALGFLGVLLVALVVILPGGRNYEKIINKNNFIFGGGKKAGVRTLISTTANVEVLDLE